jgi:hypothetical protein
MAFGMLGSTTTLQRATAIHGLPKKETELVKLSTNERTEVTRDSGAVTLRFNRTSISDRVRAAQ